MPGTATRSRKGTPSYRMEIDPPINSRMSKATITVTDETGKVVHRDKSDLNDAVELGKAAERIAQVLEIKDKKGKKKLLDDLREKWNASIEEQRRFREQAAAKQAAEQVVEPDEAGTASESPDKQGDAPNAKTRYSVEFDTPANGRVGKTAITVRDETGKVVHTDKADLHSAAERKKAAQRIAEALKRDSFEDLLASIEEKWHAGIEEYQRRKAAAGAGDPSACPDSPCSPGPQYEVRSHRIYLRRHNKDAGDYLEPLANFVAKIAGEDVIDDGSGELRHVFLIQGILHSGAVLPPATVPCGDFAGMGWVPKAWGCRANPAAGMGAKDHLRAAIQELSGDPARRIIYQHTGWRDIDGLPHYLHAGGGISAKGSNAGVVVQLDGSLSRYRLPDPPEGAALAEAVRSSLALLDLQPARILYPCVGAVYRAPLGRADSSVQLTGITGGGKSELAALMQQHYGPGMDRLNLPANWSSTANALEALAFLAKDAMLVVDDFKPGGSKHDIDQWHSKADRVLRAQGNGSGRGRCRPDGSPRPDKPPRGFILSTGEDVPRGESLQARNVPIPVGKGDFVISSLTQHQQAAAQGLYAASMAGYVRWLAADYQDIQTRLPAEHAALRTKALTEFTSAHARIPGALADLFLGLKYFLDFALHVDAIDLLDHGARLRQGWGAMLEAARQQAAAVDGQNPVRRFLRLVSAALASGRGHITAPDGGEPRAADTPEAWGWKLRTAGSGEYASGDWQPQGKQIGWIDGANLYLEPEAVYAEVQRMGEEQGDRLPLTQAQLYKRLKEAGELASYEKEKTTNRFMLQGQRRSVLHLRPGALCAGEQGEQGEQGQ